MIKTIIQPRFCDTDALGHINNTALPAWFEEARNAIFEIAHPSLDPKTWPLILAKTEINFLAQTNWTDQVEIRTGIHKLGNSSIHVKHEAWQNDTLVADSIAVLVQFDYRTNKSVPIYEDTRKKFEALVI